MRLQIKGDKDSGYCVQASNGFIKAFSFHMDNWGNYIADPETVLNGGLLPSEHFRKSELLLNENVMGVITKKAYAIVEMLTKVQEVITNIESFPLQLLKLVNVKKIETITGNFLYLANDEYCFYLTKKFTYLTSKNERVRRMVLDTKEFENMVQMVGGTGLKPEEFIIEISNPTEKLVCHFVSEYVKKIKDINTGHDTKKIK